MYKVVYAHSGVVVASFGGLAYARSWVENFCYNNEMHESVFRIVKASEGGDFWRYRDIE
jgi:hypothetical protein